jgi:hypothetical protein
MLRSCLIVIRWSCLGLCAALWDDFGATAWWSVEHRQVASVWCAAGCVAGLGRRAAVNCHRLWLVLIPGRKLLLLSARLSSGVPQSMRHRGWAVWHCFLADVLDGCFFLICVWQSTPSDWFCGSDRLSFILVSSVLSVLPLTGWQSW